MVKSRERLAQKSRTRDALLEGARALIAKGETVTVTAAAAQAGISKATAYRYFSDPAILTAEAGLAVEVLPLSRIIAGAVTVREKLKAISLYILDLALEHEAEFRQFVGMTLTAYTPGEASPPIRRGARRVPMYESVLDDPAVKLDDAVRKRLVMALSAATGAEAMIALLDVVGTDRETARATVLEIAEALIDRYLGPDFP